MSKLADKVYEVLRELFPNNIIVEEEYVSYQGKKLFFDFFIKDLGILVEVQGKQHTEFVKHFHKERYNFIGQKRRDNLKVAYVQDNSKLSLVKFSYNEKITSDLVRNKIFNALRGCHGKFNTD